MILRMDRHCEIVLQIRYRAAVPQNVLSTVLATRTVGS